MVSPWAAQLSDGEAAVRLGEGDRLEPYHDIPGDRVAAMGHCGFRRGATAPTAGFGAGLDSRRLLC